MRGEGGQLIAGTDSNGAYPWRRDIPPGVKYVRCISGSNTGQNVTIRVTATEVTTLDTPA